MDVKIDSNQEKQSKSHYLTYLFFFAILLFFCVFGITYSVYYGDGNSDQEIDTGKIIFTYSDVGQAGNGILLNDALPISDAIGKSMVGKNQYFDFFVSASTNKKPLLYKILINKDQNSTLSNQNVNLYLTQVMGSYEEEVVLTNFSDLKEEVINQKKYYVLYEKELESNLENYNESYRLRMWIKEDAYNYENQFLSIKIDVYAYQLEG